MSNAFSTKETQGNEFRMIKSLFICCLTGIFLFGICSVARATIPFEDNFDAYSIGDLAGQNEWTSYTDSCQVDNTKYVSSPNSIKGKDYYFSQCEKIGIPSVSGEGSFKYYVSSEIVSWDFYGVFQIKRYEPYASINISVNKGSAGVDIKMLSYVIYQNLPYDIWTIIYYDFDAPTGLFKISLDNITWSEEIQGGVADSYDIIEFYVNAAGGSRFIWLDNLEETEPTCNEENCFLCETEGTCEAANCFWYYSFYRQQYFCIDQEECGDYGGCPFCSTQETCGTYPTCLWLEGHCYFYGTCGDYHACPLCSTQETCEAFETCEWVNNQCYFEEEMPPIVEWEGCEYENCDPLGLPEKWVCLLKNMIMGQFCPSQEKITDLYNTFDTMKARFPFNYANAMSVFFSDIKDSLSEEKAITFSILGKEGEVDFDFWENTTTIGGEVETFANLVKDFTSIIILLGFFFWLIGFIKRFMV